MDIVHFSFRVLTLIKLRHSEKARTLLAVTIKNNVGG